MDAARMDRRKTQGGRPGWCWAAGLTDQLFKAALVLFQFQGL